MRRPACVLVALLLTAAPARAEAPAPAVSAPARCSAPAYHQFDFWLGDWTVTDGAGAAVATAEITRVPGSCGLFERLKFKGGGEGVSFNVYDPRRQAWLQMWESPGVVLELHGALQADGTIAAEGVLSAGGKAAPLRVVCAPQPDGSVRQEFLGPGKDGAGWVETRVNVYRRG